jgi:hypothetical protein
VPHNAAYVLSGTRSYFQQTFILNAFQQIDEVLNFQFCYRQMTNYRENVVVHTAKHAIGVIFRPGFIAFMPVQSYGFEGFFR